ncbi:hypothetical protein Avbf_09704 [Armadillidium vulgare]|nr:hypothetical protein Avbf_09704 [Armadillidium vulgare]
MKVLRSHREMIWRSAGFAILPNKFASGGIGSARASERGGLSSPQITSPGHHKKLHSLEPLEQVDSSCVLGHQPLSKIPPLRSARAASTESLISDRDEEAFKEEEEEEEENNEQEEVEDGTDNERTADEEEEVGEEIGHENENRRTLEDENTKNEDLVNEFETKDILITKSENEEISQNYDNEHEALKEQLEREDYKNEDRISSEGISDTSTRKEEKRGSMETRDSGISLQSPNQELVNDNFRK